MKELERKLKELDSLMAMPIGEERTEKFESLYTWFSEHSEDPEVCKHVPRILDQKMRETCDEIESLRNQLGDLYEILPLSYIAQEYFGKSRSWLYQRLNGYKVRGRAYTLSPEQKQTFNRACQDIGHRIGSYQLS
ncbi:MAG: DUF5053 domain-containing protein [Bacteroidaceae bacterium]|nr:DUF5053 domain-containing protein [Bacteroidaceae bacterium]